MIARRTMLPILILSAKAALAQKPVQPFCSNNPLDKLPACVASAPPSPAAPDKFPSPGEQPARGASQTQQFPFPGDKSTSSAKASTSSSGIADAFPFPGEDVPAPVLDPNEKPYRPEGTPPISPASSSSGSGSDDPVPTLKDEGTEGSSRASRRKLPKVEDLSAREEEDVRVARYYHSTGSFQAAYLRAKDAVRLDPADAEAQLVLAESAQRLAKKDEAVLAYAKYLELSPDGHDVKLARKALADLH